MRLYLLLFGLIGLVGFAPSTSAHEIRPAFLQIREVDPNTYDILWKTPAQGEMRLALNVELPASCRNIGEPRATPVDAAVIERWRTTCDGGLIGKQIGIENLETSLTDVIVRFEPALGPAKTLRLNGATPRASLPAKQPWSEVAGTYFRFGVEHILFGFDHLLFVLCLLILVGNLKRLLGAITAFAVAVAPRWPPVPARRIRRRWRHCWRAIGIHRGHHRRDVDAGAATCTIAVVARDRPVGEAGDVAVSVSEVHQGLRVGELENLR